MPSKTTTTIIEAYDAAIAELCVTSDDPRRAGRCDSALFDIAYLDDVRREEWVSRGGTIMSRSGTTFAAFMARKIGCTLRLEDNEDYTADNYTKRVVPEAALEKAAEINRAAARERRGVYSSEFHPRKKWKSKLEITEIPVICQGNNEIVIKINACYQHLVPKYAYFDKTGLYFRSNSSKKAHGRSIATHILHALDAPVGGRLVLRKDPIDYRIDPETMSYESCLRNKCVYYSYEDQAVLEILVVDGERSNRDAWPANLGQWYTPNTYTPDSEFRIVNVLFDINALDRIREGEYDWGVCLKYGRLEIMSTYTETCSITLKKVLATVYGLDFGPKEVASRFSKYYQRAIESDDYAKRARFENMTNDEKVGAKVLFTKPRKLKYRHIRAEKEVFVDWLYGGIGAWCLDMREQSMYINKGE